MSSRAVQSLPILASLLTLFLAAASAFEFDHKTHLHPPSLPLFDLLPLSLDLISPSSPLLSLHPPPAPSLCAKAEVATSGTRRQLGDGWIAVARYSAPAAPTGRSGPGGGAVCGGEQEYLWPRSYGLIDKASLTDLHNLHPTDVNGYIDWSINQRGKMEAHICGFLIHQIQLWHLATLQKMFQKMLEQIGSESHIPKSVAVGHTEEVAMDEAPIEKEQSFVQQDTVMEDTPIQGEQENE
ncbi:hypothetical protein Taro_051749 [Colocasia esculenta]|uniref:Uncharacterized protein n=1 Tax=Colocasia esculenta TaxID=4460 RepID=A0A843XHM8_COLES|nr:hypothetical protein [Colocasia esculenta]